MCPLVSKSFRVLKFYKFHILRSVWYLQCGPIPQQWMYYTDRHHCKRGMYERWRLWKQRRCRGWKLCFRIWSLLSVQVSTNGRGAHFKKDFNRLCWLKHILNNFSQGFQKCQYHFDRTMPLYAQALPTQPTYRLGFRLRGQSLRIEGVCLIKKLRRVLFLELKN